MDNLDEADGEHPERSGLFTQTHWSVVLRAKEGSFTALDTLFAKYRKPLLVHVLSRGFAPDRAEDLVQGFAAHLLSPDKKPFLDNVSQQKGKFRTFLFSSFDYFINDEIAKEKALKRGAGNYPESLNATGPDGQILHDPKASTPTADVEYDRAWVQTIVDNSVRLLEHEFAARGKADLYHAIEPAIHDDATSSSYRDIASRMDMTEGAVKAQVHLARKRLRTIIHQEIMQTVNDKEQFDDELTYLIGLLNQPQT
jgi:DNA-directed RNA polymerase specialized sigma24 family protein